MTPLRSRIEPFPGFALLDWIAALGGARHSLIEHGRLHGQLAGVELEQEKRRLFRMLLIVLAGFCALTCTLLCAGVLVLAITWDTAYRVPAIIATMLAYAGATFAMWVTFRSATAAGERAFAASLEELAADAALLRTSK